MLSAPAVPVVPEMMTVLTTHAGESGTCGEDLTWTLDDEGTLTISGTGEMTDYKHLEICLSAAQQSDAPKYIGKRTETHLLFLYKI